MMVSMENRKRGKGDWRHVRSRYGPEELAWVFGEWAGWRMNRTSLTRETKTLRLGRRPLSWKNQYYIYTLFRGDLASRNVSKPVGRRPVFCWMNESDDLKHTTTTILVLLNDKNTTYFWSCVHHLAHSLRVVGALSLRETAKAGGIDTRILAVAAAGWNQHYATSRML